MTNEASVCYCMRRCVHSDTPASGVDAPRILKVNTAVANLYAMRCSTGSQCSSSIGGLACNRFGTWNTILAALFCTHCSFWMAPDGTEQSIAVRGVVSGTTVRAALVLGCFGQKIEKENIWKIRPKERIKYRLLPFDATKKLTCQFFVVVVSYYRSQIEHKS